MNFRVLVGVAIAFQPCSLYSVGGAGQNQAPNTLDEPDRFQTAVNLLMDWVTGWVIAYCFPNELCLPYSSTYWSVTYAPIVSMNTG